MNCPFCNDPEIRQRTIVENTAAFAMPTNIPIVPGHVLVITKRHVGTYEGLSAEEKLDVEELRSKLKNALAKAFGAEGFNYAWNEQPVGGQSVPHFHLHMLPRKQDDAGVHDYEPRKFLYRPGPREASPGEELQAIAKVIKESL